MEPGDKIPNPISLAREIFKLRKERHPFGANYTVKVRLGHAEIHDLTAIADIVAAIGELGYEVVKRSGPEVPAKKGH